MLTSCNVQCCYEEQRPHRGWFARERFQSVFIRLDCDVLKMPALVEYVHRGDVPEDSVKAGCAGSTDVSEFPICGDDLNAKSSR